MSVYMSMGFHTVDVSSDGVWVGDAGDFRDRWVSLQLSGMETHGYHL